MVPSLVDRGRTRCPTQNARNRDSSVRSDLIGFRFDLLEHVEVVLVSGSWHPLEDTDFTRGK
jgi:hypothetical protein